MGIKDALFRFAVGQAPGAVVLQGRWGVGKTHLWKEQIVPQLLASTVPRRHKRQSYVSMFGLQSLEDLKAAIFQAGTEFDTAFPATKWRFANFRWLWWKAKQWLPFVVEGTSVPYVKDGLARSYNALTFYTIRDRLICLDDIERRGANLRLLDVLGLISHLAEQRNCRVVVILNSDSLQQEDKAVWQDQKEKVFAGEMTFSPTVEECIDLGLAGVQEEPWAPLARECLLKLKVSNIRIIGRAIRSIKATLSATTLRPLSAIALDRVVKAVVMLEYSHNGRAAGAPPMDAILGTGRWAAISAGVRDEELSEEEELWTNVVRDYGVYFGDELDLVLAEVVTAGFPDPQKVDLALRDFEARAFRDADRDAFRKTWMLYHDSLEDNAEELLDTFERTWPPVSDMEGVENLQSLLKLFRLLGRPDTATRFINEWIEQRKEHRIEELDPDQTHFFGPVKDPELREAMSAAYVRRANVPDLRSAIQAMGERHGMSQPAIDAIAAAGVTELITALIASPGRNLSYAIKQTLQLGDHPEHSSWADAREKMKSALTELAIQSPLLADRMQNKFGISPPVDAA